MSNQKLVSAPKSSSNMYQCLGEVLDQCKTFLPFSIFTATVRQVGDFLMPKADA